MVWNFHHDRGLEVRNKEQLCRSVRGNKKGFVKHNVKFMIMTVDNERTITITLQPPTRTTSIKYTECKKLRKMQTNSRGNTRR